MRMLLRYFIKNFPILKELNKKNYDRRILHRNVHYGVEG